MNYYNKNILCAFPLLKNNNNNNKNLVLAFLNNYSKNSNHQDWLHLPNHKTPFFPTQRGLKAVARMVKCINRPMTYANYTDSHHIREEYKYWMMKIRPYNKSQDKERRLGGNS